MPRAAAALLGSAALHAALFALVLRLPSAPPPRGEDVAVDLVETPAPPPPPAAAPPAPAPEPPRPVPAARPPPRRTALAPPPDAPPPPAPVPDEAPPPPNAPPPADAPAKAPVRIGVAMSATTEAGGFAAPVGNTMYGRLPGAAPAPGDVGAYRAERYVPPTQVTVLPKPLGCDIPEAEYPPEARRLELEGPVVLMLLVDPDGRVADARVVSTPGPGFGDAAIRSAKRHCRFEPPRRGDERVATWIRYTIRYELP